MRDSKGGETNDELSRLRSTRGKVSKVKTHSALAVVKGHERGNKVFGEGFMNPVRGYCEDAIVNNFLGVGVEVTGYTLIHPFGDLGRSSAVARREARLATAACILSR